MFLKNEAVVNSLVFSAAGVVLTALSYLIASSFGLPTDFTWLEVIAVATSYACTLLCVTQNRANYYFGVVTVFLYSILFYSAGLYAVGTFNAILVLSLIYGWWRWGPDGKPLQVSDVTLGAWSGYALFAMVITALMVVIFKSFGAEILAVDVIIAALSGVAQLLLDNKKRQTWAVWAVVNVFSIWLFIDQMLYLVAIQYVFFLINTIVGWTQWSKSMKSEEAMA